MDVKLLKVTHSFVDPKIYYVDVEVDGYILIKGMKYYPKNNKVFFPTHYTEGNSKYTPITFTNPETFKNFISTCLKLLSNTELPKNEESISDEKKKKLREARRMRIAYSKTASRRVPNSMERDNSRQQKDPSPRPAFSPNVHKKSPVGVWARPDSKRDHQDQVSYIGGKKFTEVALPTRRY